MQLLMLSGNSLENKAWIYQAKEQFADLFESFYVQDYRHWQTGESWIDLTHELAVLRAAAPQFAAEYGVFAKSIGTVLAIQAIQQSIIKPKWLLFCGVPMDYVSHDYPQFAAAAAATQLPLTVIHNEHDKVGEAAAVAAYINPAFVGRQDFRFIKTPGDTHNYEDYNLLRAELTRLRR
jgi:hypothetical protein